jgi:hypothetical protein
MVVPNNCTILTIRNRHRQPAPDLHAWVEPDAYVAYFENGQGNQWIFVRPRAADRGILYSSTVDWNPHEVRGATDELAPELALDDHERAWLTNAWLTSEARA